MTAFFMGVFAFAIMIVLLVAVAVIVISGIWIESHLLSFSVARYVVGLALICLGCCSFLLVGWEVVSCLGQGAMVRWVEK